MDATPGHGAGPAKAHVNDLSVQFLRALYPEGHSPAAYVAVCASPPGQKAGGMLSAHVKTDDVEGFAANVAEADAGSWNTYATICAHAADLGPNKRGGRAEKVLVPGAWLDIDLRGPGHAAADLPESVADAAAMLAELDFEPSMLVHTGGGLHAYWLFERPVAIDGTNRTEVQNVLRAWQARAGELAKARGWHLDNTSDLARVLRVPGTHNHKPGRDTAPEVTFLIHPSEGQRYDFRVFCRFMGNKVDKARALFAGPQRLDPGVQDPETADAPATEQAPAAEGIAWTPERTRAEVRDKAGRNRRPERTETLRQFLDGKPWARKGERDAKAQALASWLCFYTGGLGDINAIVEMAQPSLIAMAEESPEDFITEAQFEDKVARAMADARRVCDEQRRMEERIKERSFAEARGRFETTARAALGVIQGVKLPVGAPQDAPAANPAVPAPGAEPTDPAGCAPAEGSSAALGGAGAETSAPDEYVSPSGQSVALAIVKPADVGQAPEAGEPEGPEEGELFYTRAELEQAAEDQTALSGVLCSVDDLKARVIIQKGESFYVLVRCSDGLWRYKEAIQRGEMETSIPRDLRCLPASLPDPEDPETAVPFFQWDTFKADGATRRKTLKEVLAELCTVARGEVVYDLRIPRSYYDPRTQTFFVAACPVRPDLGPEHSQLVDAWLRTFGENQEDTNKFLDFLATITDLRHPTCGVFLSGPPGTGKTMLAKGAARIWTVGDYTEMDAAIGNFNAGIASCPLLVADEALPTDHSGRPVSTKILRRLIGSDRRPLRRKFMSDATIVGAVRCLFLANNEDMLNQGDENLGSDALEAVAGRFLHIRTTKDGADFLRGLGGRGGTRGWVDEDVIARHLLWLRDNRPVKYGHRFIVDGHEGKVSQLLATSGTIPGLVAEWLARFLASPRPAMLANGSVVLGDGKFWVNGQRLLDSWMDLIKSDRAAPTLGKINRALANMSFPSDEREREYRNGKRIRYWKIRPEMVLRYAEDNQIGDDVDEMRARINKPPAPVVSPVAAAFGNDAKGK